MEPNMSNSMQVAPESQQIPIPCVMDSFQSPNSIIYLIFQPIVLLGKVLGLISWCSSHPSLICNQHQLMKRMLNLAYKASILFVFFLINIWKSRIYLNYAYDSQVSFLVNSATTITQIFFLFLVFIVCFFKEHQFFVLLKLLFHWNNELKKTIKRRYFHLKHTVFQVIFTLLSFSSFSVCTLTDYSINIYTDAIFILGECYFRATDIFLCVFFTTAAYLSSECFSVVTSQLSEVLRSTAIDKDLQQIRLNYEHLYQTAAAVQNAFSWLITLQLAQLSVLICLHSYCMLHFLLEITAIAYMTVTLVMRAYLIYTISAAAGNITQQARLGLESLNNVIIKNLSHSDEFQVTTLAYKLGMSPIEITAAGNLFRVNTTTFTTITGTIFTYLIVLLQFRTPSPSPGIHGNDTEPSSPY